MGVTKLRPHLRQHLLVNLPPNRFILLVFGVDGNDARRIVLYAGGKGGAERFATVSADIIEAKHATNWLKIEAVGREEKVGKGRLNFGNGQAVKDAAAVVV